MILQEIQISVHTPSSSSWTKSKEVSVGCGTRTQAGLLRVKAGNQNICPYEAKLHQQPPYFVVHWFITMNSCHRLSCRKIMYMIPPTSLSSVKLLLILAWATHTPQTWSIEDYKLGFGIIWPLECTRPVTGSSSAACFKSPSCFFMWNFLRCCFLQRKSQSHFLMK